MNVLKKIIKQLFLVIVVTVFVFNLKAQNDVCKHLNSSYFAKNTKSNADENFDIIYQQLNFTINPDIDYVSGNVKVLFKAKTTNLSTISFDLSNSLTVDSVKSNAIHLSKTHSNRKLTVFLTNNLTLNQIDSVTVYYKGVPSSSGFGSFVKSEHNGNGIIWTLSEPFGAADWLLCKESFSDKIDSLDLHILVPNGNKAAGIGVLTEVKNVQNNQIMYSWKHRYPIAFYLVALAVTNYESYTDWCVIDNDSLPVLNYVFPESLADAKSKTPQTAEMIQFFSSLFGKYPFWNEKYGHAQFGWGGGMEHQTMSFMNNFNFNLTAHELAHQWFGDKVTCSGWDEIWLNESFATYLNGLAIEKIKGKSEFDKWKFELTKNITSKPDGSVYVYDSTNFSAIFNSRLTYNKGAMVLHLLRLKMGDEKFFAALKEYLETEECSYKFGTTPKLTEILKPYCTFDVDNFVDKWIYKQGFPRFQLNWEQSENKQLILNLEQFTTHESVSYFEVPLKLLIKGFEVDTIITLELNAKEQDYVVSVPFFVEEIKLDPNYDLITSEIKVNGSTPEREVLKIYPNPAINEVIVFCDEPGCEILEILIYDSVGKKVKTITKNKRKHQIEIDDLNSGFYYFRITTNNGNYFRRVNKP